MQIISKGERNYVLQNGINALKQDGWELEYRGIEAPTFDDELVTAFAVVRKKNNWATLRRGKYTDGNGRRAAWHHTGCLDDGYDFIRMEMACTKQS